MTKDYFFSVICFGLGHQDASPTLDQEVKNGLFGSYAAMLTLTKFCRSVSEGHLPVGHTLEDIGA